MLIAEIPIKNINNEIKLWLFILPSLNNNPPTNKLNNAHITFTTDIESPLPGGFAKGVGNLFPEIPCTKCGTALAKKTPEKKDARY